MGSVARGGGFSGGRLALIGIGGIGDKARGREFLVLACFFDVTGESIVETTDVIVDPLSRLYVFAFSSGESPLSDVKGSIATVNTQDTWRVEELIPKGRGVVLGFVAGVAEVHGDVAVDGGIFVFSMDATGSEEKLGKAFVVGDIQRGASLRGEQLEGFVNLGKNFSAKVLEAGESGVQFMNPTDSDEVHGLKGSVVPFDINTMLFDECHDGRFDYV
jgi:hypothetical protein